MLREYLCGRLVEEAAEAVLLVSRLLQLPLQRLHPQLQRRNLFGTEQGRFSIAWVCVTVRKRALDRCVTHPPSDSRMSSRRMRGGGGCCLSRTSCCTEQH